MPIRNIAVGTPQEATHPDTLKPETGLLQLREGLQVFANLRPATVFPQLVDASTLKREVAEGVDLMVVRELTGGIYFGKPRGFGTNENGEEIGFNTEIYAAHEIDRIARVAFNIARKRGGKLCSVTPPFLDTTNSGLTYGRLVGVHRHALKTDIINFLEGCNLTLDDVKMEYTRSFNPISMMVQFPTYSSYDNAIRVIGRKGRLYKLDRIDRSQWDIVTPYDGRTILIEGLPRSSQYADLDQIVSGYEYDSSSVNMFLRAGEGNEPVKMATIRFHSRIQAMNAFIAKNGTYCLNNRISIHVLQ